MQAFTSKNWKHTHFCQTERCREDRCDHGQNKKELASVHFGFRRWIYSSEKGDERSKLYADLVAEGQADSNRYHACRYATRDEGKRKAAVLAFNHRFGTVTRTTSRHHTTASSPPFLHRRFDPHNTRCCNRLGSHRRDGIMC